MWVLSGGGDAGPDAAMSAVSAQVVHYSLIKPTKEGLYAAMDKEVVFVAKPLLDTLIYRTVRHTLTHTHTHTHTATALTHQR